MHQLPATVMWKLDKKELSLVIFFPHLLFNTCFGFILYLDLTCVDAAAQTHDNQ